MPTGERDPDRVARIIAATMRVVSEKGVEGLTHRAVAAEAGVPLGSTTYYFSSRESLLAAALGSALELWRTDIREWASRLTETSDLAEELTDWHLGATGRMRSRSVVEYELYVAAMRRPGLQGLVREWDREMERALSRLAGDRETGRALALTATALTLQSLAAGTPLKRAQVLPVFRRVLAQP